MFLLLIRNCLLFLSILFSDVCPLLPIEDQKIVVIQALALFYWCYAPIMFVCLYVYSFFLLYFFSVIVFTSVTQLGYASDQSVIFLLLNYISLSFIYCSIGVYTHCICLSLYILCNKTANSWHTCYAIKWTGLWTLALLWRKKTA